MFLYIYFKATTNLKLKTKTFGKKNAILSARATANATHNKFRAAAITNTTEFI